MSENNHENSATSAVPLQCLVSLPIKFRAWYKDKWLHDLRIDQDGSFYPMDQMGDEDLSIDCSKIIVTQYIGVKDTNGGCIYVGDVVTQQLYWDVQKKEPVYFEVVYHDAEFKIKDTKGEMFSIGRHSTIVGNIFES